MTNPNVEVKAPAGTFRKLSAYEGDNALGNSRTRRTVVSVIDSPVTGVDMDNWPRWVTVLIRRGGDRLVYGFTIRPDEGVSNFRGERRPLDARSETIESPLFEDLLKEINIARNRQRRLKNP